MNTFAHGGRTNSQGCHNNKKTGDYHCHNGGSSTRNTTSSYFYSSATKQDCARARCSQISNCQIAVYKLYQCGHTSLDGDNDGIPCESICTATSVSNLLNTSRSVSKEKTKSSNKLTDRDSVVAVQRLLNELGFNSGIADGIPGSKTKQAILQFEQKHGLDSSGHVTKKLLLKLKDANKAKEIEQEFFANAQLKQDVETSLQVALSSEISKPEAVETKETGSTENQKISRLKTDTTSQQPLPWWVWVIGTWFVFSYVYKRR